MKYYKNKLFVKILGFIGVFFLINFFAGFQIKAFATESSIPTIILEQYSVTNEQIVPGEEVTLTLYLKNCSETMDASHVLVDITNPDGMIPLYGTVSQVYIDEIAAGETKEVSVEYSAETSIDTTFVDFSLTVVINNVSTNYISLRVPCGADVPFRIISAQFPDSVMTEENVTSALTFEVLGDENVRNVVYTLSVDGEVIGSSTIGTVTPGTVRTQNTIVTFKEPGEYQVEFGMEYMDKTDQKQSYKIGTTLVSVYENKGDADIFSIEYTKDKNEKMHKSLLLGISGVCILAIFVLVVLIRKKK